MTKKTKGHKRIVETWRCKHEGGINVEEAYLANASLFVSR